MMRMGSTPGRRGASCATSLRRVDADLFNLQRDGIGAAGQPLCCGNVVPGAHDRFVDHEARRARGFGIHDAHAIAHGARGHGGHAAKLASAENANQAAGFDDRGLLDQERLE